MAQTTISRTHAPLLLLFPKGKGGTTSCGERGKIGEGPQNGDSTGDKLVPLVVIRLEKQNHSYA